MRLALTPTGTLVFVGGETGGRWLGGLQRQLGAAALSPFIAQRMVMFVAGERATDLDELRELIDAGTVTPILDSTYPLGEVPDAIRRLRSGLPAGKIAITI